MANRFLDTNYYKSPFVRSLKGPLKSLYSFIICDCDGAGIWNFDLQAAEMYIGFKITDEEFNENFVNKGKAIEIGGGKYFFPDFIEHQYPSGLQANNKAHKNFISILTKYGLIDSNQQIIKKEAPLKEPSKGSQVMSCNGLGNGNGLKEGGVGETKEEQKLLCPEMVRVFKCSYPNYPEDQFNDHPACLEIAYKIAKQKGWGKESVMNGRMDDVIFEWGKLVIFSKADKWFSTRAISDFNKEFQRLIQKITNGQHTTSTVGKDIEFDKP